MSLNWKELEVQVQEIAPVLTGSSVQKVTQTGTFAGGEALVFHGYSHESGPWRCIASVRGNFTFFGIAPKDISTDNAAKASTFIMVLRKHFLGPRITRVEQMEGDRMLRIAFEHGKSLLLELMPRRGNVLAIEDWDESDRSGRCLGSLKKVSLAAGGRYALPESKIFEVKEVRDFADVKGARFNDRVMRYFCSQMQNDTFGVERAAWAQSGRSALKKIHTALRNAEKDVARVEKADGLREQAMALSEKLYELGPKSYPRAKSMEIETLGEKPRRVKVALDAAYTFAENAERMFKQAKKLERAEAELSERLATLRAKEAALAAVIAEVEAAEDSETLRALAGRFTKAGAVVPKVKTEATKKANAKSNEAKEFLEVTSSDGFTILCGRNQMENRAVTFQHAVGNDVWLHLKGVPGAHVVIKSMKQKTVPLTTLLEAAQLVLYYSKIRDGKKADVDYTFRKHVKPIKGTQADVTYTDNKTLYVESDGELLRKILRQSDI